MIRCEPGSGRLSRRRARGGGLLNYNADDAEGAAHVFSVNCHVSLRVVLMPATIVPDAQPRYPNLALELRWRVETVAQSECRSENRRSAARMPPLPSSNACSRNRQLGASR